MSRQNLVPSLAYVEVTPERATIAKTTRPTILKNPKKLNNSQIVHVRQHCCVLINFPMAFSLYSGGL